MSYTIYIDAMGGDQAPLAAIDGAIEALRLFPDIHIMLAGTREAMEGPLKERSYDAERLEAVYKEQVVADDEHNPAAAVRSLRDSSLMYGMRALKEHRADAVISSSNTGAVLSGATLITGRIPGVHRPALPVALPGRKGTVWMLDVGANMDSKPAWLAQYARMMTIYCKKYAKMENPSVGLLNVGTEPGKGNALVKETYDLLSADPAIRFVGNVEAREVMNNAADIIVTDGFAGNVYLKTVEGVAKYIVSELKEGIMSSLITKIGGMIVKPAIKGLKDKLDPSKIGGSIMLGVNGVVIKNHGNSDAEGFVNTVRQAIEALDSDYIRTIAESLAEEKKEA